MALHPQRSKPKAILVEPRRECNGRVLKLGNSRIGPTVTTINISQCVRGSHINLVDAALGVIPQAKC